MSIIPTTLFDPFWLGDEDWLGQPASQVQPRGGGRGRKQRGDQGNILRPRMDWYEVKDKQEIMIELPGLDKSDIELSLHDNVLTISGNSAKLHPQEEGLNWLMGERRNGPFSRSVAVSHGLKEDEIKASMANGLLKIEMPKQPAESASKKIAIA